ncbi:S24 family peptidase [Paracoccus denitrificans]|uniref:S24 family peptidase n=1 Tax=Paracoccus denitrificans TaxID=266 RepID=UPI003364CC8B
MTSIDDDFPEMVRQRLEQLGTSPFAVEHAAGLPADAVRNVLRGGGKSGPTLTRVRQICDALGLELYIGPPREAGPVERILLDGADYAHIPLHDAMLAAGAGCDNSAEQVIDQLAFRRDWLKRIGVPASTARLARVQGDSMQPTMWPGDMILIDTQRKVPAIRTKDGKDQRRSPIYAMIDNGEARVKRIERPSAELMMLISDNPDYAPEVRQGGDIQAVQIIGKVVWWGHTVKE